MDANLATLICVSFGKAPFDIPALTFREGDGNVGIMRSPLRAIALPARRP
jgi:hypothetical protein